LRRNPWQLTCGIHCLTDKKYPAAFGLGSFAPHIAFSADSSKLSV